MSQKKIVKFVKYYTQKGYLRRQLKFACESFVISQISSDYRYSNWRSYAFMYIKEVFSIYLSLDLIMKANWRTYGFLWSFNFLSGFLQTARIVPEWLCTNKNRNKQKNRHHDHLQFIQHCQILLFVFLQSSRTSAFLRLLDGTWKEKSIWITECRHPVELAFNNLLERVWIPL